MAIKKFISVMVQWKRKWTELKELTPLKFMPYVAKLFREVTGKDLLGLGHFTGWIRLGGYYHWRVVQQGLIHLVPCLQDEPRPRTPKARPSGWPLPPSPAPTETPAMGALAGQPDRAQPTPQGGGRRCTSSQGESSSTAPSQAGRPSAPHQSRRLAPTSRDVTPATSGGPTKPPSGRRGAGDGTGANWYQMVMRESGSGISEAQGPPFPIVSARVRWEAVGQIYGQVDGKEPPASNIISRALQTYYMRVNLPTLNTWACQVLCILRSTTWPV